MQDGATCHTTPLNLDFLRSKFAGRVISHKTDLPWPPNSPDLNPLDFFSGDTRWIMCSEQNLQQSRILSQLLTILQKTWIQISSKEHVSLQR